MREKYVSVDTVHKQIQCSNHGPINVTRWKHRVKDDLSEVTSPK